MAGEQKRKFTRKRFNKDDKNNRQIGNNHRLGPVSANRHLRQQLAKKLHNGRTVKGLHQASNTNLQEPVTTGQKLWNVWNSVKLLFNSGTPVSVQQVDGVRSNIGVPGLNRIPSYAREDSSRSTIDTSLEYMPVQQENIPTGDGTTNEAVDPRDETIARLKEQVALLKKKVKYAREKNALYKSLLDEANIGTSYLESRRHIKNLVRDNMKPESELPPSPERKVDPLVTSSPIRQSGSASASASSNPHMAQAPPQLKNYYNKYPTLPHTESLAKQETEDNVEEQK
ncbi:nuclear envelope protein YPR174C [Monosporozyma unispora]|nr:hypothetical protein C6P44_000425 [Kazachstania unispora]